MLKERLKKYTQKASSSCARRFALHWCYMLHVSGLCELPAALLQYPAVALSVVPVLTAGQAAASPIFLPEMPTLHSRLLTKVCKCTGGATHMAVSGCDLQKPAACWCTYCCRQVHQTGETMMA